MGKAIPKWVMRFELELNRGSMFKYILKFVPLKETCEWKCQSNFNLNYDCQLPSTF